TDVRRERQMEGIALAKCQGVYTGGKARLDRTRVKQLAEEGVGPAKIARELGMARSSVYRLLEETHDSARRAAGSPAAQELAHAGAPLAGIAINGRGRRTKTQMRKLQRVYATSPYATSGC